MHPVLAWRKLVITLAHACPAQSLRRCRIGHGSTRVKAPRPPSSQTPAQARVLASQTICHSGRTRGARQCAPSTPATKRYAKICRQSRDPATAWRTGGWPHPAGKTAPRTPHGHRLPASTTPAGRPPIAAPHPEQPLPHLKQGIRLDRAFVAPGCRACRANCDCAGFQRTSKSARFKSNRVTGR